MNITRRRFQTLCLTAGASSTIGCAGGAATALAKNAPSLMNGCATGDVSSSGAMFWTRADQPSRLWIELSRDSSIENQPASSVRRIDGGTTTAEADFNFTVWVDELTPSTEWYYRLQAESLETPGVFSNRLTGRFLTADSIKSTKSICFCWSGDTAGQGWGVAPFSSSKEVPDDNANTGMRSYAAMLTHKPQFLVHSGDQIYADGPIQPSVELDDGSTWHNIVTEAKSKVAETTQDFRENYYYNYLDSNMRDFHAQVPVYYQWDDHEVINNWFPGEIRQDDRYTENNISVLAARAKQAMFECNPVKPQPSGENRIYRTVNRGPLLDLFFLDLRSYRGPNSQNRQREQSSATDFLGQTQLAWLKEELASSTARWKIICSDMPLGVVVADWGTDIAENAANGEDGAPLGRELELAGLLTFIKEQRIENLHFITADVHYCASNYYSPERASFKDFSPFWEHISGPLHAGTFAPGKLDNTFGPDQVFCGVPTSLKANRPPSEPYQFFGKIDINHDTEVMSVSHYNSENRLLWSMDFAPA